MNLDHAKRVLEHQDEQMNMLISSAFPGRYLKAEDLAGETVTVTINGVKMEQVARSGDPQPVVYFREFQKGLVLNKTNSKSISKMHGDETNGWRGKKIDLYEAMVEYQGDVMPALRVRITQQEEHMHAGMSAGQAAINGAPGPAPSILVEGEAMARQGLAPFRSWRDGLSAAELDTIRPFLERLTATAKYADKPQLSDEAKTKKAKGGENEKVL